MKNKKNIIHQSEKVSVIIALYNAEEYIQETLESVILQSWKNIEIILVNDGSTDKSEEIINNLKIPNLKVFNKINSGQCAASNFGISKASGDFVKFLDADDILSKYCIENMVIKYREHPNRLVFGEWHHFTKSTNFSKKANFSIYKDYDNSLDWYLDVLNNAESMLAGWMWLIPSEILKKSGGWNERLHLMNDFEFSTRLILESDGIGFANNAIHFYRKGLSNSMTSKMNNKIALSIFTGVNEAFENIVAIENSVRVKNTFANQFQKWVYHFYPLHSLLVKKMEVKIMELGGSTIKPEGGILFKNLNRLLPWKIVMLLQYFLHKTAWKPILKWKNKRKLNKYFNRS